MGTKACGMGEWENIRGVVMKLLQKNDSLLILNWKICCDVFIRRFMLRQIFALKIIKGLS